MRVDPQGASAGAVDRAAGAVGPRQRAVRLCDELAALHVGGGQGVRHEGAQQGHGQSAASGEIGDEGNFEGIKPFQYHPNDQPR